MIERLLDGERQLGGEAYHSAMAQILEAGDALINLLDNAGTPTGKLLFTLMSALAQFERDVIAERTKEGLRAARARGRKGGRPRCDQHKLQQALKLYEAGKHTLAEIEELTGIKKATLYRACKNIGKHALSS